VRRAPTGSLKAPSIAPSAPIPARPGACPGGYTGTSRAPRRQTLGGRYAACGSLLCNTWTSCPDRATGQHHLIRGSSSRCRKGSSSGHRLTATRCTTPRLPHRDTGSVRASRGPPQWKGFRGLLAISGRPSRRPGHIRRIPGGVLPEYLWYHFGNLHDNEGTPNSRKGWTFGIVERLFERLLAQGITTRQRYGMFGHSAGGQFVQQMLSFGFRDRVAVAVSTNAGSYTIANRLGEAQALAQGAALASRQLWH
jgi:hypothetical protein